MFKRNLVEIVQTLDQFRMAFLGMEEKVYRNNIATHFVCRVKSCSISIDLQVINEKKRWLFLVFICFCFLFQRLYFCNQSPGIPVIGNLHIALMVKAILFQIPFGLWTCSAGLRWVGPCMYSSQSKAFCIIRASWEHERCPFFFFQFLDRKVGDFWWHQSPNPGMCFWLLHAWKLGCRSGDSLPRFVGFTIPNCWAFISFQRCRRNSVNYRKWKQRCSKTVLRLLEVHLEASVCC